MLQIVKVTLGPDTPKYFNVFKDNVAICHACSTAKGMQAVRVM